MTAQEFANGQRRQVVGAHARKRAPVAADRRADIVADVGVNSHDLDFAARADIRHVPRLDRVRRLQYVPVLTARGSTERATAGRVIQGGAGWPTAATFLLSRSCWNARRRVLTLTLNRPERLQRPRTTRCTRRWRSADGRGRGERRMPRRAADRRRQGLLRRERSGRPAIKPGQARPDLGESLTSGSIRIRAMHSLPKPVVCAVNGPAAGAASIFALACDIVLAAKSAKFLQPSPHRPRARRRRHLDPAAPRRRRARRALRCWPIRSAPNRRRPGA